MVEITSNGTNSTSTTEDAAGAAVINITSMATSSLESKLNQLRQDSNKHSQLLTAKLATSKSGQNLLHIGNSLSTLPPDLHSLITDLYPILTQVEKYENQQYNTITQLVSEANQIRHEVKRINDMKEIANLYKDLIQSEKVIIKDYELKQKQKKQQKDNSDNNNEEDSMMMMQQQNDESKQQEQNEEMLELLDHVSALERTAHTTLILVHELQVSQDQVSNALISTSTATTTTSAAPAVNDGGENNKDHQDETVAQSNGGIIPSLQTSLKSDTERAQFMMKLSSRIRKLETDIIAALTYRMEVLLKQIITNTANNTTTSTKNNNNNTSDSSTGCKGAYNFRQYYSYYYNSDDILLILGSIMRSLAILGHGKDVENIFARIAIMPLIRSKVSMGRLDEGGSRGECNGLSSLLHDMITSISTTFGNVLIMSEFMFNNTNTNKNQQPVQPKMDIDLITCGVWVPIVTTLMADAGIKMAIFSPGIANVLQSNYIVLDSFLKHLASNLLLSSTNIEQNQQTQIITKYHISMIQCRLYEHSKTYEFYKKWNLPIYYQLRFGECCNRLNNAVYNTIKDGWLSNDVYTGSNNNVSSSNGNTSDEKFELPYFQELYDILLTMWNKDVILKPLTNRFLRGAIQLLSRSLHFINDGLDKKIQFGVDLIAQQQQAQEQQHQQEAEQHQQNGDTMMTHENNNNKQQPMHTTRTPYFWADSEGDVGAVAWELTLLESILSKQYIDVICQAIQEEKEVEEEGEGAESKEDNEEQEDDLDNATMRVLILELIQDVSNQIGPIISKAWNTIIVNLLINKCIPPLAAVKGVAATYRMTNRPPPIHSSPFVITILRPVHEFCNDFNNRIPPSNKLVSTNGSSSSGNSSNNNWKYNIIATVALKYSAAIEELLQTVQRTEVALKNRKARRTTVGGMSDGEKVKLQLYLDYITFYNHAKELFQLNNTANADADDIDKLLSSMKGMEELKNLTKDGKELSERSSSTTGKTKMKKKSTTK